MAEYGELRPGNPSGQWFPRTARDFSLNNIERDVRDWYPQYWGRKELESQAQSIDDELPIPDPSIDVTHWNPDRNPGSFIKALVKETKSMPVDAESWLQRAPRAADPLAPRRGKLPGRVESSARQQFYLRNLLKAYGTPTDANSYPARWKNLPEEVQLAMMRYATNSGGFRDEIDSGDEFSGYLGTDSPLNQVGTWFMAMPRAAYAVGDKVFNPNAPESSDWDDRLRNAAHTMMAPAEGLYDGLAGNREIPAGYSAWSDQRAMREALDSDWANAQVGMRYAKSPADLQWNEADKTNAGLALGAMLPSGDDGQKFFTRRGFSPTAARWAGATTDAILNPWFEGAGLLAALRAGNAARVGRIALTEFGPDYGIAAAEQAAQAMNPKLFQQRRDEMIDRLGQQSR